MLLPLLAVLPSAVLLAYTYRKDTIEKEPLSLLCALFIGGALTVVSAVVLGGPGRRRAGTRKNLVL